jgi:multidrug resistance protein, MATE family
MSIRTEMRPMLRLALPVIAAELGWMTMGVVDTWMVGPLGPAAIGATGIGNSLHFTFAIFGMGLLLGLDTLVSQSLGAGRLADCHRWFFHGVALAVLILPPLMLLNGLMLLAIPHLGFHPDVLPLLQAYFAAILWSTLPLMFYAAFRRYLQGIHHVAPVMFALVSANVVNAFANWVLIYGHFGFPAMGVAGSAWSTVLARCYMAAVLLIAILRRDRWTWSDLRAVRRGLERTWLIRLFRLGFPAASQITLEVGVFGATTALAGTIDPISSAAHQIAINFAAVTFMIPLGLSSAGAVRVGHAIGAGDPERAAGAGWAAILLGVIFMTAMAVIFVAIPRPLIGLFSKQEAVLALGASLLVVGAVFQLFDGLQGVTTGVLRGIGETRLPMIANLGAHWLFGLPLGYTLCFTLGFGAVGLWVGLSAGLLVVGLVLIAIWARRIGALQEHRLPTSPQRTADELRT